MKIKFRLIAVGAAAIASLALVLPATSTAEPASAKQQHFLRRSQLILDNQSALTIDTKTNLASFDQNKLKNKNTPPDDVIFLQELTNFSNDVLIASESANAMEAATAKLSGYPTVQEYFQEATELSKNGQTLSLHKSSQPSPLATFALVGNPISEALGMADCGIYWSPKPSIAKSWVTYRVGSVDTTLRSWGYHPTFSLAGGGWTRAQTWHPWNCGWNTFRDHALKIDNTTLREQNYSGWNPRGEPNPEVYASGPWPYSTWPAYVYWWHSTH